MLVKKWLRGIGPSFLSQNFWLSSHEWNILECCMKHQSNQIHLVKLMKNTLQFLHLQTWYLSSALKTVKHGINCPMIISLPIGSKLLPGRDGVRWVNHGTGRGGQPMDREGRGHWYHPPPYGHQRGRGQVGNSSPAPAAYRTLPLHHGPHCGILPSYCARYSRGYLPLL